MQNRQTGAAVQPLLPVQPDGGPAQLGVPESGTSGPNEAIRIGLLGPLVLERGGRQITPTAPKLRLVLSLLAVQANSVTRVDQLIEELWEESPPPSALTTVQTYIYQLRKLLKLEEKPVPGDGNPAALLSRHPGGYILQLPDLSDIDSNLFEQLARRGRAELLSARVEAAAETFREALGLWRGNVLEGVSTGPLLYAHATKLDELHRTVLALRIEADLQLGRHQEIIGELNSLVNAEPTREDFSAKLMIALYRSGRRADALGVYQRIRAALVDELGLDPAAELQRLHQLMLEADPELDLPNAPVATATPTAPTNTASTLVPAQLPAEIPDFVGRRRELDSVVRLLATDDSPGLRVVNVVGRPGIGKSAFVARAAHAVRAHYPDGQLYVDVTGGDNRQLPTRQILISMLKALGADEADVPASVGEATLMFRSFTADRRLLVVLDRASGSETLHHLFPSGSGCALLVTSRTPIGALSGAVRVRLPALSLTECIELLVTALGQSRVDDERPAAERLAELADRLPLALRAVAAKLSARPTWQLSRMVDRMADERTRLGELSYGDCDVSGRLAEAYQTLTASQRWVLRRVAAGDGALTADDIADRSGMGVIAVRTALDELVDADLVEELAAAGEPRYHVPQLVRLVGLSGLFGSSWWRAVRLPGN